MISYFNNPNLTQKITLTIAIAAIGFLTIFSALVYIANERLEYDLLEQQTENEIDNIPKSLAANPQAILPQTSHLKSYLDSRQDSLPPEWMRSLPPGDHHDIVIADQYYHVVVRDSAAGTIYLQYDITEIEASENMLNLIILAAWIALIILVIVLARSVSHWLADPVARLSEEVSKLDPDLRGVQLQTQFSNDEVGSIAAAFDRYLRRMDEYVRKQQAFAAMASHELRSPMTIVQTSADLIEAQHQDKTTLKQVENIIRATRSMSDTVEALLQVTRDIKNQQAMEPVALRALVEEICQLIAPEVNIKKIRIQNHIPADVVLPASKTLLSVVCTNIIKNAVKHGGNSSIEIHWQAPELTVSDDGIGIDPQELDGLFEFAKKGQASQGYGIGLYVSKLICDHQSWGLNLQENTDGGTRATIKLG